MSDKIENKVVIAAKCSCKGYNLDKLLQPVILGLLSKNDLHGYVIVQEIENKNLYSGEKVDAAGVYRMLKKMEEKGLVSSEWGIADAGPAKKTYKIKGNGIACLTSWIGTLENYKKTIDVIIGDAKAALK